jgi:hypothetical protein
MWDLTGMTVSGQYMGEIPVTGKVRLSRVKYGGEISHHVDLDTPMNIFGSIRNTVILEHKHVESVRNR